MKDDLSRFLDTEALMASVSNSYPVPDEKDMNVIADPYCPTCGCTELLCGFNGPGCCVERSLVDL